MQLQRRPNALVLELGQGFDRVHGQKDQHEQFCPTIFPGSLLWLVGRNRLMVAYEALLFHYVPMQALDGWQQFGRHQLYELAGNQFVASQFMAAQLCAFCVVPLPTCETELDDDEVANAVSSAFDCL